MLGKKLKLKLPPINVDCCNNQPSTTPPTCCHHNHDDKNNRKYSCDTVISQYNHNQISPTTLIDKTSAITKIMTKRKLTVTVKQHDTSYTATPTSSSFSSSHHPSRLLLRNILLLLFFSFLLILPTFTSFFSTSTSSTFSSIFLSHRCHKLNCSNSVFPFPFSLSSSPSISSSSSSSLPFLRNILVSATRQRKFFFILF